MANVSRLQTTADLDASQIAGAASALLPSGVVLPFAGSSAPSGWLLCNGQEISKTTYANLFAVISSGGVGLYDTQVNPATGSNYAAPAAGNFRVPDYTGIFLRGVGTASGKDAVTLGGHQTEKTKTPVNAFTGTATNVDLTHTHTISAVPSLNPQGLAGGSTWNAPNSAGTLTSSNNSGNLNHGHSVTISAGGDNETRPLNKGVNYIIKI